MTNKESYRKLQLKREKKELKRRRKPKRSRDKKLLYGIIERQLKIKRVQGFSELNSHFKKHLYDEDLVSPNLISPEVLCLESNTRVTLEYIKAVYSTLHFASLNSNLEIQISFEKCSTLKIGPLLLLNVIIMDFFSWTKATINRGVVFDLLPKLSLKDEMHEDINNLLCTMHFPVKIIPTRKIPVFGIKLIRGQVGQLSYKENSKGKISKRIRSYIDSCLKLHGVKLDSTGISLFDSMIGEILANADDHSSINSWFVYGSYTIEDISKVKHDRVGELNLIFLNFGDSIYEGFEKSKQEIVQSYSEMEAIYEQTINTRKLRKQFPFDSMVTLYGLQEGYSRLLHINESRGAGTMTTIKAFLDLGFSDAEHDSMLYILSGRSLLKCTKKYTPFYLDNRFYLSLNEDNDLGKPPDDKNVITLNDSFPGTMLLAKLYLKNEHLTKTANEN